MTEALKQAQYRHYTYAQEALLLYLLSGIALNGIEPKKVLPFFEAVLEELTANNPEVLYDIAHDDEFSDVNKATADAAAAAVAGCG